MKEQRRRRENEDVGIGFDPCSQVRLAGDPKVAEHAIQIFNDKEQDRFADLVGHDALKRYQIVVGSCGAGFGNHLRRHTQRERRMQQHILRV